MKTSELTGAALDWAVAKCEGDFAFACMESWVWLPSTSWMQGGPIIEREKLVVGFVGTEWSACQPNGNNCKFGPTPLIAAMRCYVASKLGDEVEIPEELK